jgi:hypothetical protein
MEPPTWRFIWPSSLNAEIGIWWTPTPRLVALFRNRDAAAMPELPTHHIIRTRQNYIVALKARLRDAAKQPEKYDQIRRKLGMAYPL